MELRREAVRETRFEPTFNRNAERILAPSTQQIPVAIHRLVDPPTMPLRAQPRDEFYPGAVLPKATKVLEWALPPPPSPHKLRALQLAQDKVEAHAIKKHDAKSWYTTAAFEIKRAELTGDRRLLQSALLSLDFAEKASNSIKSRLSGDRQLHHFYIRSLREIISERMQAGRD